VFPDDGVVEWTSADVVEFLEISPSFDETLQEGQVILVRCDMQIGAIVTARAGLEVSSVEGVL
jgi:hypothetical protein